MFLWKFILFRSAAESSYLGESEAGSALLNFLAAAVDATRLPMHETSSHFGDDLDNHEFFSAQFHETGTPRWSVCMTSSTEIEICCCQRDDTPSIVGTTFLLETDNFHGNTMDRNKTLRSTRAMLRVRRRAIQ